MKEIQGDIWDYHEKGHWVVITTNGTVKANGEAVMGKGIALQAKQRFPDLPTILGNNIKAFGNKVFRFGRILLATFPTKHNWWERSDLTLIERSCKELVEVLPGNISKFYIVRPGCSSGGLNWKDVKSILEKYLDDRFIVVERRK